MSLTSKRKDRLAKSIVARLQLKQKKIEKYILFPNKCLFCKCHLNYEKRKNKFCSHSCSASFNNKDKIKNFSTGVYSKKIA